ncbi:MAG: hypothetical protein AAFO89_09410 [Planctomycetota bacterium]
MFRACRFGCAVSLLAACGVGAQGVPDGYSLIELRPLGGTGQATAVAVNNRDQVIGYTVNGGTVEPTLWDLTGTPSLIPTTGGGNVTFVYSINDEGLIVVECDGCDSGFGIRLTDGSVLGLPDAGFVAPKITADGSVGGIDEVFDPASGDTDFFGVVWELVSGAVAVRTYGPVATNSSSFFLSDGILSDSGVQVFGSGSGTGSASFFVEDSRGFAGASFNPTGGDVCEPKDINAAGETVGEVDPGSGSREAFFFDRSGAASRIDPVGCPGSGLLCSLIGRVRPTALNNASIAVGVSDVLDADLELQGRTGFIWSADAGTVDLAALVVDGSADGWALARIGFFSLRVEGPADINDRGLVVGNGVRPDFVEAPYVLIPRAGCAADVNRDGAVTPNDFNAWILAFNNSTNGRCD